MQQEIIVTFDEQDNPVISVKGVAGKGCKALTEAIEKSLGAVTKDENTREYRDEEPNVQRIRSTR